MLRPEWEPRENSEGDLLFPIFRMMVEFKYTNTKGERDWSGGCPRRMFDHAPTYAELEESLASQVEHLLASAESPSKPVAEWYYSHHESWCLGWFSHHTFDRGQSDEDILESFDRYVWRCQVVNERHRYRGDPEEPEPFLLMGAEDRWRWSGQPEDRNPPCRCDGCKKWGLIRICH